MNCELARRELLESERPERVGGGLATHLAGCPGCAAVQRRLVRLERDVRRLPSPSCPPPPALFARVLERPEGGLVSPPEPWRNPDAAREGGRQKVALAFAMAASLAVFAVAWWAWQPAQTTPGSPLRRAYARTIEGRLHDAAGPRDRVERLTKLAEDWLTDVPTADEAKLAALATQFEWLMRSDLPFEAERVGPAERAAVLGAVAQRLQQVESRASQLAQARAASGSLRRIAAAVRDGERRVRELSEARA
jgi:hypothetical protein